MNFIGAVAFSRVAGDHLSGLKNSVGALATRLVIVEKTIRWCSVLIVINEACFLAIRVKKLTRMKMVILDL